jgi:hypothetical protein
MSRLNEARILAGRWCLQPAAVHAWMTHIGIDAVTDLMARYPNASHAEAMEQAQAEFWQFYRPSELTPIGEQFVIPGCEHKKPPAPSAKVRQPSLWD